MHPDIKSWDPHEQKNIDIKNKIMGKHALKVGGEFRLLRNNYFQSNEPSGLFQFNAGMTAPNPKNSKATSTSTPLKASKKAASPANRPSSPAILTALS